MWIEEESFSLAPLNFLEIKIPFFYLKEKEGFLSPSLKKKKEKYVLPDLTFLVDEESDFDFYAGWNEEGLFFKLDAFFSFTKTIYPSFSKGDSLEIFIDTRDVKTTGYNTRFCHHFFFLLEPFEGILSGEIPHFRGDEKHPLAESTSLETKSVFSRKGYELFVHLHKEALFGFDPLNFNRLGFSFRLNRFGKPPLHLGMTTEEYKVEELSSRWISVVLER